MDAESLSRILWDMEQMYDTPLDTVLVKSAIIQSRVSIKIPIFSNALITVNESVIRSDLQLSKFQWRQDQRNDFSLKRLIELCESGRLMNYNTTKEDPADLKSMIRLRKDFFMEGGLLYRKASFKATGKQVDQFMMPQQFCKRTVRVCHEDYGHLGMDRVQILLQERFYCPKMSEDARTLIRSCEHCMHFKTTPQHDKMYPITATYPLELVHLDFLSIGGKEDVLKNVLVVTDHFTRYAQCYVTSNQLAFTVAKTLVDKYFTNYGWSDKILTDRGSSFENLLFKDICELAKIRKLRTGSYHPQMNGQCERFNKTLISML